MKDAKHADRLSGPRPGRPTNVIPFLTAPHRRRGYGPAVLADALRRVRAAGLRGGFVLLVPAPPGTERDPRPPVGSRSDSALECWKQLCDRIAEHTPLRVALLGVEPPGETSSAVGDCPEKRCVVLSGFPQSQRSVLLELARAVCSDDPVLMAEARATGVPAFEPDQLVAASRDGTLPELLVHPVARTFPASA